MLNLSFRGVLFFIVLLFSFVAISNAQNQKILDSLVGLYSNARHDTSRIILLNSIAYEYRNDKADTCLIIAEQALLMSNKIGFEKGKSKAYTNIGLGVFTKGKYPEALKAFQTALTICEKIKDKQGVAVSLNNIGNIHIYQGNYALTLEYYHKSLKITEEIGDKHGIASCLNGIGNIYVYQKNYPLALEYHKKSLKIREETENKYGIASSFNNIATIYYEQGNYTSALAAYQKSLKTYEEIGDKYGQLFTIEGIVLTYQKQGNYAQGIIYGERGVKTAQAIEALPEFSALSKVLSESYKLNKEYAKALKYYEIYKQTNDSLFNVEKSKALANLEAKVEIEHKEREIQNLNQSQLFLQKEKQFQQYIIYLVLVGMVCVLGFAYFIFSSRQKERKANQLVSEQKEEINQQRDALLQQANQLATANQTKDKLFAILGHDLRSPIASLEGVLSLMNEGLMTHDEFQDFIPIFHKNVKNMQNTLENLLQWSVSQMQGMTASPSSLNFYELIDEKIQLFAAVAKAKNITLATEITPNLVVWADPNHVRLLLRNLINNAIKFTPEHGHIRIVAQQQEAQAVLSVIDTGVGMSEEQVSKLFNKNETFTTYGTNGEKGTGLGLQLCQEIVAKNRGTIWVSSVQDAGSTFSFSLPISPK